MTKFEQIKNNTIKYFEKRIEEINIELAKQKIMSINDYIEKNIRKNDYGEYVFAFSQDPYQYVSMKNKEAVVEIAKLWLSQDASDNE